MKIDVEEIKKLILEAESDAKYNNPRNTEQGYWNDGINSMCKNLEYLIEEKIKEVDK